MEVSRCIISWWLLWHGYVLFKLWVVPAVASFNWHWFSLGKQPMNGNIKISFTAKVGRKTSMTFVDKSGTSGGFSLFFSGKNLHQGRKNIMHSIVLKHQSMSEYIIIMIMVNHLFLFLIQVSTEVSYILVYDRLNNLPLFGNMSPHSSPWTREEQKVVRRERQKSSLIYDYSTFSSKKGKFTLSITCSTLDHLEGKPCCGQIFRSSLYLFLWLILPMPHFLH